MFVGVFVRSVCLVRLCLGWPPVLSGRYEAGEQTFRLPSGIYVVRIGEYGSESPDS